MRSGVGAEPTETRTGSVSNVLFSAFLILNSCPQGQRYSVDPNDLSACVTLYRPRCCDNSLGWKCIYSGQNTWLNNKKQTTQTETL